MDRKIVLYLLGAAVLSFVGVMMMPPQERDDGAVRLPWLVSVDSQGQTQVFGFTIGETTLADIREVFGEEGKINLFSHEDRENRYSAEAYFDQIYLNGLRSDFVITIDADQSELKAMHDRGLRISQLGSRGKKVELSPVDIEALAQQPIRAITYLPWKSLDVQILKNRFSKPENTRTEESGVVHWLYPDKGMDIALAKDGGTVIQYVNPVAFNDLIAPLKGPSQHAEPTPGNLPRAGP
jgi:hypothetical protein